MGKTKGQNNKTLVSNTDMKTGSNKDMNKDHKKLLVTQPDVYAPKIVNKPIKDHFAVRHDNPKRLTKKHNDEKLVITLLIVGAGLIAYHFWQKMASLLFTIGGAVMNAVAFSGTNFAFSWLMDHGEEERKRHDLSLEKLQRARDEWNKD